MPTSKTKSNRKTPAKVPAKTSAQKRSVSAKVQRSPKPKGRTVPAKTAAKTAAKSATKSKAKIGSSDARKRAVAKARRQKRENDKLKALTIENSEKAIEAIHRIMDHVRGEEMQVHTAMMTILFFRNGTIATGILDEDDKEITDAAGRFLVECDKALQELQIFQDLQTPAPAQIYPTPAPPAQLSDGSADAMVDELLDQVFRTVGGNKLPDPSKPN